MDNLEYKPSELTDKFAGEAQVIRGANEYKSSELIDTYAAETQAEKDRKRNIDIAAYKTSELKRFADQASYEEARRRQELHEQSLNYYKDSTLESAGEAQTSKGRTR